jgi:hypothetical protein
LDILKSHKDGSANAATTAAIAYHNLGVENEFLGQTEEALTAYKTGHELA